MGTQPTALRSTSKDAAGTFRAAGRVSFRAGTFDAVGDRNPVTERARRPRLEWNVPVGGRTDTTTGRKLDERLGERAGTVSEGWCRGRH